MANNTMWLVHKPTGLGIRLGKRMGTGWYSPPERQKLAEFFDLSYDNCDEGEQDAFVLVIEHLPGDFESGWVPGEATPEGFRIFEHAKKNPA